MQQAADARWLSRDSVIISTGLFAIIVLSWAYLIHLNRAMAYSMEMAEMGMPLAHEWDVAEFATTFFMWAVMMVGMMAPTAAPMVLTFGAVNRSRAQRGGPYVATSVFLAGYIMVWTAFSLLACLGQWGLHSAGLLDADKMTVTPWLGGALLLAAGWFQFSPLKQSCLTRCRSPFDFLTTEWREGNAGALWMGIRHGAYCAGCCWMLMLLLFVAGVMNLLWVAAISAFVLAEKLLPRGRLWSYAGALACLSAGVLWIVKR